MKTRPIISPRQSPELLGGKRIHALESWEGMMMVVPSSQKIPGGRNDLKFPTKSCDGESCWAELFWVVLICPFWLKNPARETGYLMTQRLSQLKRKCWQKFEVLSRVCLSGVGVITPGPESQETQVRILPEQTFEMDYHISKTESK